MSMQVPERLSQHAFGLDFAAAPIHPSSQPGDLRSTVALPANETLFDIVAHLLGLGVDMKDRSVDLNALEGARIASAKSFDEFAACVRVATATRTTRSLDTVVGRGGVAHHAAQASPLQPPLQVIVMAAGGVQETRVAMRPLDEPERTASNSQWVQRVKHRHARGIQRGECRRQARLAYVAHHGVEQVDDAPHAGGQGIGRQRHVLLASAAHDAFPGGRLVVVIDQGLYQELIAQQAPVEHLVAFGRRAHVRVALLANDRFALLLSHDEPRGLDVELLGRLEADALGSMPHAGQTRS